MAARLRVACSGGVRGQSGTVLPFESKREKLSRGQQSIAARGMRQYCACVLACKSAGGLQSACCK
jgi:hypothetical protein